MPGTVSDIDGNIYRTIIIPNYDYEWFGIISDQVWMAENLKVTRYNDGTNILHEIEDSIWEHIDYGAYCFYDNKSENFEIYGNFYNWFAVQTNKLCPEGWRVPTKSELEVFEELTVRSSGTIEDGTGLWHYSRYASSSDNWLGFSAIPSGGRYVVPSGVSYANIGYHTDFWSSTEQSSDDRAFALSLTNMGSVRIYAYDKKMGFSVRCVKNSY